MKARAKTRSSVRQSVTIPTDRRNLNATYRRFMAENNPRRKGDAGNDLIRAIFGNDALAEEQYY